MKEEEKKMICTWFITGILFSVITSIGAILYIIRAANVNKWNSEFEFSKYDLKEDFDGHIYDVYPLTICTKFYDTLLEEKLRAELQADCDSDCLKIGTRWSLIYTLNSIVLSLLCLTYILFAIGSKVFATRLIAACLNQILALAHFAVIITTVMLRISLKGRYASQCIESAQWNGESLEVGGTTFENDAMMINILVVCQFFLCFGLCCIGSFPLRIKPKNS